MKPHNQLHNDLLIWFRNNQRELPWRLNPLPYRVWLSEIILQQTRVDQGLPYYQKFIENYPELKNLAQASVDEVLKNWQGLGYYSRARNMHRCAKLVFEKYNGEFPTTASELQSLPGIGPYTASAIASICFNEATPVVDGNVFRVLSRYFNSDIPINTTQGKHHFNALASEVLNHKDPGTHNQAMMELGALVCTPQKPGCAICPIREGCQGLRNNRVDELPVKKGKLRKRTRYFNYLVIDSNKLHIRQRLDKDVWFMLHDFPLIESDNKINDWSVVLDLFQHRFGLQPSSNSTLHQPIDHKHILSHQIIQATFWRMETKSVMFDADSNIFEADLQDIQERYAVPILIKNYLSELNK